MAPCAVLRRDCKVPAELLIADICSTPQLFSNNLQDVQVKQGILGDCWCLCVSVALQKSKYLLNKQS
ncbi:hypothetical protein AV530_004997 [Patagioenas fasciata monilis]|uniref:Calpain catalytic domain-containing protein n=1 Tax=Patagioenas fasciata monilis TaxID=372326 RepID=A0A1V4K3P1_PATFA|nr:hypothetical protein AV530_004997 [Patagioenas fasciata monilis]